MSLAKNDVFVVFSPQVCCEGEEPSWTITIPGVTTVTNDATLEMFVYVGNDNQTSDVTSGSMSSSGNVVTTKKLTALVGRTTYVVSVYGTADGVYRHLMSVQVYVRRLGDIQTGNYANDYFVDESPRVEVEGSQPLLVWTIPGVTNINNDGTLVQYIYLANTTTNKSSTMLTGSISASGNIVTLKKITGLVGKNNYVVSVFGTVENNMYRCLGALEIVCRRKGEPS